MLRYTYNAYILAIGIRSEICDIASACPRVPPLPAPCLPISQNLENRMVTATFMVLNALCLTCIYSVSKHKYIPGKLALAVHFVAYIGKLSGSNFDRYRPPKMQFCFFYQSIQTNAGQYLEIDHYHVPYSFILTLRVLMSYIYIYIYIYDISRLRVNLRPLLNILRLFTS